MSDVIGGGLFRILLFIIRVSFHFGLIFCILTSIGVK